MVSRTCIIEKPVSGASETVDLPQDEATTLSFNTSDIQGMKLSDGGELMITFTDGGSLTITNFRDLADHDVMLTLADGETINSQSLFETLLAELPPMQVNAPAAGDVAAYEMQPGVKYNVDMAGHQPVEVKEQDGALLIVLDNDGTIILQNFQEAMASENAAEINLDGEFLTLREFADGMQMAAAMSEEMGEGEGEQDGSSDTNMRDARETADDQLAALAEDLANIEPAAGDAGGNGAAAGRGGYGFNSSFEATSIDPLNDVGPIGPTALKYGIPEFKDEVFPQETQAAPFVLRPPSIEVNGGVDNAFVKEDGSVFVPIKASVAPDTPATAELTITVTGIDPSWVVTFGEGSYDPGTGTWTYTAPAGTMDYDGGLTFAPPAQSDIDLSGLKAVAEVNDPVSGQTAESPEDDFGIIVDAVADDPSIKASNNVTDEDTPIDVDVVGILGADDFDGSEHIDHYEIDNVPTGFTFNQGTDLGGGLWSFTPAEIIGLQMTAPKDYFGTITLGATVFTTENPVSDSEYDFSDNDNKAVTEFTLTWKPVIDPPSVLANNGVDDAQVKEDGSVDVPLTASLNPVDSPNAYLTVTVTGFDPAWGTVVNKDGIGTFNPAGTEWTYTAPAGTDVSTVFTFSPKAQSDIDLSGLVATAVATEPVTGTTASADDSFNVIVDAVADTPDVKASGGSEFEGTPIAINISGMLGADDFDGSESIDHYEISGVPLSGFDFGGAGTDLGGGVWSFTPAELAGLKIYAADPDFDGTLNLTAKIVTIDTPTDSEFDTTDNTAEDTAPFTVTWRPDIDPPSISVNGGVDNAQVKEDGSVDVPVTASLSSNAEASEYLTVTITGFDPSWGTVVNKDGIGSFNPAGTEWTITLPAGDALNTVFTFTPTAQSDIDLSGLVATATATDPVEGISKSADDDFNVIVDAVADKPGITANGGTEEEGTPIDVTIAGQLGVDNFDGSEHIDHYEISGVPAGFSFNNGTYDAVKDVWVLSPADLTGLQISGPAGYDGTLNLTATVFNTENPVSDGEYDGSDNVNSASTPFSVTWTPDIDPPTIKVNGGIDNAQVKEDHSVDVPVVAKLSAGAEASEYLTVTITGFDPAWGTVVNKDGIGSFNPAGTEWTYTAPAGTDVSTVFTFSPKAQSDIDLTGLKATVVATDPVENLSASADDSFNVIVDAVADTPSIDADGGTKEEGQPIDINISGQLGIDDFDGSEHIDHYEISGIPSGFTLNNGTYDAIKNVWVLSPADLTGLQITPNNAAFDGSLTLTATIFTTENPVSDGEFDASDNTATASDKFTVTWEDDDEPILTQPETVTVDETNLSPTTSISDKVEANFGDDTPGSFSANDSVVTSSIPLFSEGEAVTVTRVGNTYTGTTTGGEDVFTLVIQSNGNYTFTLLGTLDHPVDGPSAADHNDPIDISFGVTAKDSDGDTADGFIKVTVLDDGPKANNDVNDFSVTSANKDFNIVLMLDVSGSMGGSKLALLKSSVSNLLGDFNAYTGGEIKVHIVPFSNNAGAGETFTVTDGAGFTAATTYLNGLSANGSTNYEAPLQSAISWLQGATANDPISGADTYSYFISDGAPNVYLNGTTPTSGSAAVVMGQITGTDGTNEVATLQGLSTEVIGVGIGVDATTLGRLSIIDSNGSALDVQNPSDLDAALQGTNPLVGIATGNVITGANQLPGGADVESKDQDTTVTLVSFGGTDIVVDPVTGGTINGTNGVLEIFADGSYEYNLFPGVTGTPGSTIGDVFVYTLTDGDGDTDTATLTLRSQLPDDQPDPQPETVRVDETDFGPLTVNGDLAISYGNDAPGPVTPAGASTFSYGGSYQTTVLRSDGHAVTVSLSGDTYVGTRAGDNKVVFELQINTDGTYSFTAYENLDHKDPADHDDTITLNFGYTAEDGDGDTADSTITVEWDDDGPVAVADSKEIEDTTPSVSGNVMSNDDIGTDFTLDGVVRIKFGTQTINVPNGGDATIDGDYGTLVIDSKGNYTYTPNGNGEGTDVFTYTICDTDQDIDTATLTIKVTHDDIPVIADNSMVAVDETNMSPETSVNGTITADFGADGPGSFSVNNTWTLPTGLTSNGLDVTVTQYGNSYVGSTTSGQVFTLALHVNGYYTFYLRDTLDHPDTGNHNDVLSLSFGVTARDKDGDTADGTITVKVYDDGLTAHDDLNVYDSVAGDASGNVITGLNGGAGAADDLSNDMPNTVTKIAFGATEVDVPVSGTVTIDGDHGTLEIAADGSYTYTAFGSTGGTGMVAHHFAGGPGVFPDMDESQALDASEQQAIGIAPGDLDVAGGDQMSMTYVGEYAGYSNTVGVFTVAADGTLLSGKVLIADTDATATGATFDYTVGAGSAEAGFFLIADGADLNNYAGLDFDNGSISFIVGYGTAGARAATINDNGSNITLVYNYGTGSEQVLSGPVYYSSERGAGNMNPDGQVHVVADLADESNDTVLRIGFEDLPCLGDKDYNDAIFDVSISSPGCADCGADEFVYTLTDGDGDTSTAVLTLECAEPELIVGENVDDKTGSTTDYHVGTGEGVILGGIASDILIGDVGGSRLENQTQDYNFVLMLDVSGSMGSSNDANSRLSLLIDATANLLNDLGAYNNGDIKVHLVPFSTDAYTAGTFTVTDAGGLADALSFLNTMPEDGWTNYEAALQSAISWLEGNSANDPISGAETISYFISDGAPNYYLNDSGTVVSNGDSNISMNQINGIGDSTNEIATLQSLSDEVIGVGIEIGGTTLTRLGQIDSDGTPINVDDVNDLNASLQASNPLNKLASLGDDVIEGGSGNDLIFGDSVNTDQLALDKGLGTNPGAGWTVFDMLEATSGWDRDDTIAYIRDHAEELAAESVNAQGETRQGGDDTLRGGAGDDTIFGQEGDDLLAGGLGDDTLYGGSGADTFLFEALNDNGMDTVKDFDAAEDVLDLSELLAGTSATQATIDQFVFATDNGSDTVLSVDLSGSGNSAAATDFAVLENVNGLDIDTITTSGNLLVA